MTHTEHKLQLATLGMFVASKVLRQRFTVKVKPWRRVRTRPTQTFRKGKAEASIREVDQLLNLRIRGARVGRPVESRNNLASVNADEIVPKLRAIILPIFRDDERAEGSVDVERGVFFIFHTYKIAQITQNARDFFTIVWIIFVDVFSNERFILQVGMTSA